MYLSEVQSPKINLNMEALSIDCRNKQLLQCFNQILITSTGLACSTTARQTMAKPVIEIKY